MTTGENRGEHDPSNPVGEPEARPDDPGAFIGNRPEREAETIPGGIHEDDERIAAHSTQVSPVRDDSGAPPDPREAGQSR